MKLIVDSGDDVDESKEGNNTMSKTFTVEEEGEDNEDDLPDLIMEDISFKKNSGDNKYHFVVRYKNIGGDSNIGGVSVQLVDLDTLDSYSGSWGGGSIPAGMEFESEFMKPVNENKIDQPYRLKAVVDSLHLVDESDESNNTLTKIINIEMDTPITLSISDEEEMENLIDIKGMSFVIRLDKESNENVKVDYETVEDTAEAPRDFTPTSGTLTIPAGNTTGVINVLIINDELEEGNETFKVVLSNPVNAIIDNSEGIATILDDDQNQQKPSTTGQTGDKNNKRSAKKRLWGRLLLDVDSGGAIWYIDTTTGSRYSVKWDNALPLFQKFSVGITDGNLLKIPAKLETINPNLDTDGDGYTDRQELRRGYNPYNSNPVKFQLDLAFANSLKGKFLLQVEKGGAIWYVDQNGYRHNVRWNNLKSLFESLALGITNSDLSKIEME